MKTNLILKPILLITTILLSSCFRLLEEYPLPLGPGDTLPQFSVTDNNGNIVTDETLKEGVAVIIHFNTWCPDCVEEMPHLERIYQLYKDRASFIAIARGEGKDAVDPFMTSGGYSFPYACEPDRTIWSLFDKGAMKGVPAVYLSAPGGTIVGHWYEEDDIQELENILNNETL